MTILRRIRDAALILAMVGLLVLAVVAAVRFR